MSLEHILKMSYMGCLIMLIMGSNFQIWTIAYLISTFRGETSSANLDCAVIPATAELLSVVYCIL